MSKKSYINPRTEAVVISTTALLAASRLDSTVTNPSVIITDEEYGGEFSSRRFEWTQFDDEEY